MNFFLEPSVVMLPDLVLSPSEDDKEKFFQFIESLNDWAMLLNEHKFYSSNLCKDQLYSDETYQYPPSRDVLELFWKTYQVGEVYALREVWEACQRILDIDTLTSIEYLAEQEKDPNFEVVTVSTAPKIIYEGHHEKMRDAVIKTLGCLSYFQHIDPHKHIFSDIVIATRSCTETINVDTTVYKLYPDATTEENTSYHSEFRTLIDPSAADQLIPYGEKLKKSLRVVVVNGHPNFHKQLEEHLKSLKNLELRCIPPEEDALMSEYTKKLNTADVVIEVTSHASHKIKQIADKARELGIPTASLNSQGIEEFKRVLLELAAKIP